MQTKLLLTRQGAKLLSNLLNGVDTITAIKIYYGDGINKRIEDVSSLVHVIGSTNAVMSADAQNRVIHFDSSSVISSTKPSIITELGLSCSFSNGASDVIIAYADIKSNPIILMPSVNVVLPRLSLYIDSGTNTPDTTDVYVNGDRYNDVLKGFLGVPVMTVCDTLPVNDARWHWFDGSELKKSDYADLWDRVKDTVAQAVSMIESGLYVYGGTEHGRSYYGWYKGTTDDYFKLPDLTNNATFLRPVNNELLGVFNESENESHTHDGSTSVAGDHTHTLAATENHTHLVYYGRELNGTGSGGNYDGSGGGYRDTSTNGAHSHTLDTVGAHSHTVTLTNTGGTETRPKNTAVKIYGLVRV